MLIKAEESCSSCVDGMAARAEYVTGPAYDELGVFALHAL